jgi:hypothetical protein
MYGEFLIEASEICKNSFISSCGKEFVKVSEKWEEIASLLWELSQNADINKLKNISDIAAEIYGQESNLFNELNNKI